MDKLHYAINNNQKISFKYYEYNIEKKKQLRNDGKDYIVSPYGLTVSDENYYVIAHYPKYSGLTHFRVDRMADIDILDEKITDIKSVTDEKLNLGEYSKKMFNMFSGDTEIVKLECANKLINPIIDRFGEEVNIHKADDDKFIVTAKVNVSPTFFAWVFTFEGKMKIIEPDNVVKQFDDNLKRFFNT